MENEIVSSTDGVVTGLGSRSRGSGLERSGHLRARVRVSSPERCADLSELAGEQLGATATTAENWLLVEVPGTWQRDVAAGAGLSGPGSRGRSRMAGDDAVVALALRSPSGSHARGRTGSRSSCAPERRTARSGGSRSRRPTSSPRSTSNDGGEPIAGPLVLVCGHGARDACCARRGTAVYAALAEPARQGSALALVAPGWPPLRGERARAPSGSTPRARRARGLGTGRRPCAGGEDRPLPLSRPLGLRGARPGSGAGGADSPRSRRGGGSRARRGGRRDRPLPGRRRSGARRASSRSASGRPCRRAAARIPSRRPASSRASCDQQGPSGPEVIGVVGDPDDHLAQTLGRVSDGDERPERHARIAPGHE